MENVKFEEWAKLDLRVAEIIEVDDVDGSDKLYKLLVDLGTETRTIMAGLKPHYSKENLVGKKVVVFSNLDPRSIMGIESKGMILAASNGDSSEVKLINPDGAMDLGSKIS